MIRPRAYDRDRARTREEGEKGGKRRTRVKGHLFSFRVCVATVEEGALPFSVSFDVWFLEPRQSQVDTTAKFSWKQGKAARHTERRPPYLL
jgi:hypothetical protein